jgi:uncharacterized membrane protein
MSKIVEWVCAVLVLTIIVLIFAFGGVLITATAVIGLGMLAILVIAGLIVKLFKGITALFRRVKEKDE